jgi:protein-disulfide isomerase
VSAVLDRPRLAVPVDERDHVLGQATAPVTLVEYGDYECPYCRAAQPVVAELRRRAGELVLFAYRHFPLTQIHPFALDAALAAEAAGAQGAFWPMHELLFANQDRLAPHDLLLHARSLELDLPRFADDLQTRTYEPRVREQFIGGVRSGVNGTPTFFVNGVRHNGPNDLPSLLAGVVHAAGGG